MRRALVAALVAFALPALAQGPGTQIRATPQVPSGQLDTRQDAMERTTRCDRLASEDLRQRCLAEARNATAERTPVGPSSVGGGSSAGAGSRTTRSGNTAGAAGTGGSAPR
jgi:hypothetical protein